MHKNILNKGIQNQRISAFDTGKWRWSWFHGLINFIRVFENSLI